MKPWSPEISEAYRLGADVWWDDAAGEWRCTPTLEQLRTPPAKVARPAPAARCPRDRGVVLRGTCTSCGWDADAPTRPPTETERRGAEGHIEGVPDRLRRRKPSHGKLKL